MIFKETWLAVLAGRKTETTRFRKPRSKVGQIVSVRPDRTEKAIAYIQIDEIRRCLLKEQLPYFREEGFPSESEFKEAIWRLRDSRVKPEHRSLDTPVYVYKFHLVKKGG